MLELSSKKGSTSQRSKNGCLTCRRRRKKCDEKLPVCSRCERSETQCIWPQHIAYPNTFTPTTPMDEHTHATLGFSTVPTGPGVINPAGSSFLYSDPLFQSLPLFSDGTSSSDIDTGFGDMNALGDSVSSYTLSPGSDQSGSLENTPTPSIDSSHMAHGPVISAYPKYQILKGWDDTQDYGPQIIWPPKDLEDSHDFDPEGAIPVLTKSIDFLTRSCVIEPVFQEIFHFFSTFLSRVFYDYAIIPGSIIERMLQRFKMTDSAKYGMLATAVLFRTNYERTPMINSLRSYAKELYSLASRQVLLDLKNDELPPHVKLAGLIEVTSYEYYSSTLSRYYPHVLEAASIVRQVIGGDTLDLLSISEEHTFDVRCFAWCDILHSMATSRPTLLKYVSDIEQVQRHGSGDDYANPDKGIEWIYGCPDILTVLIARITALRHSPAPKEEKSRCGIELEQLVLNWVFGPTRAKGSVMRVARVGVQEVWRHVAILYIHQAIFRSDPTHPTVRNSVRNILRIASTLKPGVNPDCFLSVPYFIAASFATSQNDRYILKSRILSCGNERFLRNLAFSLDDIWAESDATGRFTSWSDKEPPTIVF
ncbi:unnamed protein product [Rhizoctonia solani]|uniref:Zn(2)-C6 fungal-type domain-containing protein n=1 Tax=Rhizoctonia solani TaxID=456999 RepID=A0A8H2X2F3_9AGAM|nr:unnamed protein product [Rhizoctonia solani]